MEFNKKIIILIMAIFLVGLLAIGAASAADVADMDNTIGVESNQNSILGTADDDFNLEVSKDNDMITGISAQKSFKDLNDTINKDDPETVYLTENYIYNSTGDGDFIKGIIIDRNVTIYGNGITIDGAKNARIFYVTSGNVVIHDIIFKNGNSSHAGGAIEGKATVINCTFINNYADLYGGAISEGTAINSTFTGNSVKSADGGAMSDGNAINCTFINNHAGRSGGATYNSSVTNCIFSSNYAKVSGGAMDEGSASNCTFILNYVTISSSENPNYSYTTCKNCREHNNATLSFPISIFDSILLFDVKDDWGQVLNDVYTKINIKNQTFEADYYALSGEGWPVEVPSGLYNVTLSCGNPKVQPVTQTVAITIGTTFLDLYIAINGNTADEITLDGNYAFDPATDSAFINGIVIDRKLTINGNGFTINADGKAHIFNITSNDVVLKDITFKGGYAYEGGAIYWSSTNATILNCCFVNNTATYRAGAIYFKNEMSNVIIIANYTNNTANYSGGANYFEEDITDAHIIGNYISNTAENGGANYFGKAIFYSNINGNYSHNTAQRGDGGANFFQNMLKNVILTGNYCYNKASHFGGANCFSDTLIYVDIIGNYISNTAENGGSNRFGYLISNVNIIGNYTNNTATNHGGANYFVNELTDINIIGNYINNTATNHGGANYFVYTLDNVNITGDYINNTAQTLDGGANLFLGALNNVNMAGNYISNTAENGGANYFGQTLTNSTMAGNYINNTGDSIIYIKSSQNSIIKDSIFLNDDASNIQVDGGNITITNNWFGNNASNKDVDIAKIEGATAANWYFLDIEFTLSLATVSLNKLYSNGTVVVDDKFKLSDINLALIGKNINVPSTKTLKKGILTFPIDQEVYDMTLTAAYNTASYTKTEKFGDFDMLQNLINKSGANSIINLNRSYIYTQGYDTMTDGILISNNNVTINGNGYTIDATGKTRIFKITGTDVTLNNITFTEGNTTGNGGAIYWSSNNANILNCYFVNNTAKEGGANYFSNTIDFSNINATFINNTASENGGANNFNQPITNVNITGNYINNTATYGGGANIFQRIVTNVNIIGNYIKNKAKGGGANSFDRELNNVNIIGNYTDNTANDFGGANEFNTLTNVNIIGNYNRNKAVWYGGANYFTNALNNVNITGKYTDNKADYRGGANFFNQPISNVNIIGNYVRNTVTYNYGGANHFSEYATLTNVTMTGNYTDNAADYGGANSFFNDLTNVTITGNYINNKATNNGGALNFAKALENVTIIGNYIRNSGLNVIYISNSTHDNVIKDSVFINNPAIGIEVANGNLNVINNWFGNNASNYGTNITNVKGVEVDNWLFLNAEANPAEVELYENSTVVFMLCSYTKGSGIVDYNETMDVKLVLSQTLGELNKNIALIGEEILYSAKKLGNSTVTAKFETAPYTIELKNTKIDLEIYATTDPIIVGESAVVVVSNLEDATGNVSVRAGNGIYFGPILSGVAEVIVPNMTCNTTAIVAYVGDAKYAPFNESIEITVYKNEAAQNITIPENLAACENSTAGVVMPIDATGTVALMMDGVILDVDSLINGVADLTIPSLAAGNYTIEIIYSGDDTYNSSVKTTNITVNKEISVITATKVTTTYKTNKNLVITLTDDDGELIRDVTVAVDLNGVKKYTTDKDGKIKVATGSLVPKTYIVNIRFDGNENYTEFDTVARVVVKKATPKITAKKKTFKTKVKTKKYAITLKDDKGKAIKNVKVTLKVKGKTYTAKTNSKGKATFKITKLNKKGKYTAVIKYNGNKYYNKVTKKAKITVKTR